MIWLQQDVLEEGDDSNLQCCEYQLNEINKDYGFEINIGEWYNRDTQTCTVNGVEQYSSAAPQNLNLTTLNQQPSLITRL